MGREDNILFNKSNEPRFLNLGINSFLRLNTCSRLICYFFFVSFTIYSSRTQFTIDSV